jgi:predicted 3-demethylubiquinone-9 3-methyltransferase (glyoxalase superfamily)
MTAPVAPVRTVLWFNGRGMEAAAFYCATVPDSRITGSYASAKGGPDGAMWFQVIDFTLNGAGYQILDCGPGGHRVPMTMCVSIMLLTPDQAETDRLWEALVDGGGSHSVCGWLTDRFGVAWQVTPARVMDLLTGPDRAAAARAHAAVMAMTKLDLATIMAAAAG